MNASMNDTHNLSASISRSSIFFDHLINVRSLEVDACFAGLGQSAPPKDCMRTLSQLPSLSNIHAQYEFERRKYAQDLIAFDKKFSALFSGKPKSEEYADGVTHEEFLQYAFATKVLSYFS